MHRANFNGMFFFWQLKKIKATRNIFLRFFLLVCFFWPWALRVFCLGLDFSASVIVNFIKLSGSDSPVTNFLDSPWDSFLNSEYLTYKMPLHDDPIPAVSWGLSTKRTVNWDTKASLMMTIHFWLCESICSRLGLNDILSLLEFRLLLMTQVSLHSWNFLIFHAVVFSFCLLGH